MKVKLNDIKRYSNDKDGNPLKTKDGRLYTRLVIGTDEHQKPLSGFDSPATQSWAIGQEVEIEVEEKGQYLNFKIPKAGGVNQAVLEDILNKLTVQGMYLKEMVEWIRKQQPTTKAKIVGTDTDYPTREDDGLTDEAPF